MKGIEINFDGLVGPTHHYAGIAFGNTASELHAFEISNPKAAALQGLKKMHLLMDLGIPQAVLPPQERPFLPILRELGYCGKDLDILEMAYQSSPQVFKACYSASSMWVANAATVTPSVDSDDCRVHITPANLLTHLQRSIEAGANYQIFKKIFSDEKHFVVHPPLFSHLDFADEGAANHNRFCHQYHDRGIHLFVYGRSINDTILPLKYPARQTLEASMAIARLHQLDPRNTIFAKQNPKTIDEGVFHNEVIAVANQNVFLYHEAAFEDTVKIIQLLKEKSPYPLFFIPVSSKELSVAAAVRSYLFNSQLITLSNSSMALIVPMEVKEQQSAYEVVLRILQQSNPIQTLHFVDCKQSMQNGGGPACLRLRMVLTPKELKACNTSLFLNEALYQRLVMWVEDHYRESLAIEDLLDPELLQESYAALDELTQILELGSIYNFQKI